MQSSLRNVVVLRPRLFARHLAWNAFLKSSLGPRPSPSSNEEDAKAAILEKVMKGRLPSDLMLRCT